MPATSVKPRLAGLALVAVVAVIALSVAMCGSKGTTTTGPAKPAATPAAGPAPNAAPPPAPPPPAKDYVEGLIESVSGGTIQLRTRSGRATVDFAPSTRVMQVAPAKLTDVTAGSCVNVRATPQSAPTGGAITAQSVTITSAVDGKCPPPVGFYGTVTSVSGDTIAVSGIGARAATTNVTVANSTSFQLQTPTDDRAIANGKCMGAQGIQDAGVLHAVTISLQTCPPMGHRHHHHLHLPHLPFHL